MADSDVQLEVEDWVRREWLPRKYAQEFQSKSPRLKSGGTFIFDAVSADRQIVANISTSSGITSGGKRPSAKLQKLRADMLFLLLVEAEKRLIVLTENDMFTLCQKEKNNGRVPAEIEFLCAELPDDLSSELSKARKRASLEVSPFQGKNKWSE
jgi:hypothetical protein